MLYESKSFVDKIRNIIYQVLNKHNLLTGEWNLGVVDSVVDSKNLMVFVNNSLVSQKIPCNPDITFISGDQVFVHFVNRDSKNKFIPYKTGF